MDSFSCGICIEIFDSEKHLPKSLRCGHTMCSMCLDKVLVRESESLCPFCKREIEKDFLTTNFALLSLKDELKELTHFREKFPEKLKKTDEERAAVAKKQKSVDSFVAVCGEFITTLDGITEDISSKLDLNEAIEKSNEVNKKLRSMKVPSVIWHTLRDCATHKEFMFQLCDKAEVGPVFAVHAVEKRDFLGSVTFHGRKCYVHSLALQEIYQRSNATFVPFQDLKLCWMKTEFGAFLEISTIGGPTVRPEIRLGNRPNALVTNFVNLCTGELGPSYKGVTCIDCGILTVPGYISNGRLLNGPISLNPGISSVLTPFQKNDYVLVGCTDGSFYISKAMSVNITYNTIATFRNVPNFERFISFEPKAPKILNCGLVFDYD